MDTKYGNQKNITVYTIIAGIWLLFSCIFILNAAYEGKIYEGLANNQGYDQSSTLGKKILQIENTFQANEAIQEQDYEKALELISGTASEDYYNRGTIQTLIAYKNALQSNVSWLETAQKFIAQADQNFTIAKRLSPPKNIREAIVSNESTIDALSSVIDIKTCYGIGQAIITNIDNINDIISAVAGTLSQEEMYIEQRAASLGDECYQKLNAIVDTSKEQVGDLGLTIKENAKTYRKGFWERIDDPLICIDTPYQNILPSIIKGAQWLSQYQSLHQNTIAALQSNDKQSIEAICNQTQNDSQINQQIQDSVQEMLEKVVQEKYEEGEQQTRAWQQVQYKDFFSEDEQKVLEDIQKINRWRINNVLKIKSKERYNAQRYINEMFNQFYGNSGDFIDLHK